MQKFIIEYIYLFGCIVYTDDFVITVDEQYVFWLEICVCELVVMEEQHAVYELVGDMPHLLQRVWLVVIVLLQNIYNI